VDSARVLAEFAGGATIVLQGLHRLWPPVIDFVRGKVRYYPGMGTLIGRFYEAIRTGGAAPVDAAEGAEVVRVTESIWSELGDGRASERRAAGLEV